tara:strand:- start:255 stop:932 length:678 start_codon:yes stop_codon:yes gene_type:complete
MKNDFYNGIIVGTVQTLIGHPFDTLKVLQQTGVTINYNNIYSTRLFRGILYPMCGSGLFNSIQFGTYQYFNNKIDNILLPGLLSGFISGIIINPIDMLKINRQLNNNRKLNLVRGTHITCMRESLSTVIYFNTYYKCMEYSKKKKSFDSFLAGGTAGVLSWFFTYPIDIVKTRIQSYKCYGVSQALWMGGLTHGLSFCLARAFIVNGSGFAAYNFLTRYDCLAIS